MATTIEKNAFYSFFLFFDETRACLVSFEALYDIVEETKNLGKMSIYKKKGNFFIKQNGRGAIQSMLKWRPMC